MKKTSLICLAFAFLVTAAVAQSAGGRQSTPSSPGMNQAGQQPGYPSQQPGAENPSMGQTRGEKGEKAEKHLKGCVQSQGGQYVLATKRGKAIPLTGQDVSAHVGHEVALKGSWESAGAGTAVSAGNAGAEKTSEKAFSVANVEMISDSCSGGKSKGSSSKGMETPGGNEPSGRQAPTSPPPSSQPPQ